MNWSVWPFGLRIQLLAGLSPTGVAFAVLRILDARDPQMSCLRGFPGFDYHVFPWVLWLLRGSHPLERTREATYSSLVSHMCHHLRLSLSFFQASFYFRPLGFLASVLPFGKGSGVLLLGVLVWVTITLRDLSKFGRFRSRWGSKCLVCPNS